MIISGVITLYFQAAKGQGMVGGLGALYLLYVVGILMFTVALGCGLPLKRVLNGNHIGPSGRVVPRGDEAR